MQIPVLIEPVAGNGYRAEAGAPFAFRAEAPTREEAVQKVKALINQRLKAGTEIVQVDVPTSQNPWLKVAGTLDPNDPDVQEWLEIMAENRRKADEDPNYP